MSGSGREVIVSRVYRTQPDECAHALTLLLTRPVVKEAGRPAPEPTDRDAERNQSDGATSILP